MFAEAAIRELHDPGDAGLQGQRLAFPLLKTPSYALVAEHLNDVVYGELRLSQTHDLWHVITGFDTTVVGEIGLQAFHLTQFPYPLASALTAQLPPPWWRRSGWGWG